MSKIKRFFIVIAIVITFGLFISITSNVKAEELNLDLDFKADSNGGEALEPRKNLYEDNEQIIIKSFENEYLNQTTYYVVPVRPAGGTATYVEDDGSYTFDYAIVAQYYSNFSQNQIKMEVYNPGVKVDVYYCITENQDTYTTNASAEITAPLILRNSSYEAIVRYSDVKVKATDVKKETITFDETGTFYLGTQSMKTLVLLGFKVTKGSITHNVTIHDRGETSVVEVPVDIYLKAKNRPCYSFGGYYLDENFENAFDYENTYVTEDMELYVKWDDNGSFDKGKYAITSHTIYELYNSTKDYPERPYRFVNEELNDVFTLMAGTNINSQYHFVAIGEVSNTYGGVKLNLPAKGKLIVNVSGTWPYATTAKLIDSNDNNIEAISGNVNWTKEGNNNAQTDRRDITYSIDSAGTYYFGGTNYLAFYSMEFIPEVLPLVQEAKNETYTYIRFVSIINSDVEINATDVTFSITMNYTDKEPKTVNYTPYVVKRITQSGSTYVANVYGESHTFDNAVNPTEYYVVFVLRLTTSKYSGNTVKATITYNDVSYESSSVTI
ncbi:MAG: hypothetical protein IKP77_04320 [Acholeplasmatales bacterium]|nr:hypothetical protein [Acholeplasmatales bacterium]